MTTSTLSHGSPAHLSKQAGTVWSQRKQQVSAKGERLVLRTGRESSWVNECLLGSNAYWFVGCGVMWRLWQQATGWMNSCQHLLRFPGHGKQPQRHKALWLIVTSQGRVQSEQKDRDNGEMGRCCSVGGLPNVQVLIMKLWVPTMVIILGTGCKSIFPALA